MFSGCVAKQQQGEKGKQNEVKRNKRGKLLLHVSLSRFDPKTTWTWSAGGTPPALVVGGGVKDNLKNRLFGQRPPRKHWGSLVDQKVQRF